MLAFVTTAALKPALATIAPYEQFVARIPCAVHMGIGRLPALMTLGNDMWGDAFAHSFVENEIFADKLAFETLFPYLMGIIDHAALKVLHVLKAFVPEVGRKFLASDAAGAIEHNVFGPLTMMEIDVLLVSTSDNTAPTNRSTSCSQLLRRSMPPYPAGLVFGYTAQHGGVGPHRRY